jgi:hypothetical protein
MIWNKMIIRLEELITLQSLTHTTTSKSKENERIVRRNTTFFDVLLTKNSIFSDFG